MTFHCELNSLSVPRPQVYKHVCIFLLSWRLTCMSSNCALQIAIKIWLLQKKWKSSEICQITGIVFSAYFHLLGIVRMEEACDVSFSSEHFLIYQNSSSHQHFTFNIRRTKGRKAVFIQGCWAVVQEWVPDVVTLKTLVSKESLVSFMG